MLLLEMQKKLFFFKYDLLLDGVGANNGIVVRKGAD